MLNLFSRIFREIKFNKSYKTWFHDFFRENNFKWTFLTWFHVFFPEINWRKNCKTLVGLGYILNSIHKRNCEPFLIGDGEQPFLLLSAAALAFSIWFEMVQDNIWSISRMMFGPRFIRFCRHIFGLSIIWFLHKNEMAKHLSVDDSSIFSNFCSFGIHWFFENLHYLLKRFNLLKIQI